MRILSTKKGTSASALLPTSNTRFWLGIGAGYCLGIIVLPVFWLWIGTSYLLSPTEETLWLLSWALLYGLLSLMLLRWVLDEPTVGRIIPSTIGIGMNSLIILLMLFACIFCQGTQQKLYSYPSPSGKFEIVVIEKKYEGMPAQTLLGFHRHGDWGPPYVMGDHFPHVDFGSFRWLNNAEVEYRCTDGEVNIFHFRLGQNPTACR